jgi:hypothetical protein
VTKRVSAQAAATIAIAPSVAKNVFAPPLRISSAQVYAPSV